MDYNTREQVQELEKLIDLADAVSESIQKLHDKRFKLKTEMLLSTVIFSLTMLAALLLLLLDNSKNILVPFSYTFGLLVITLSFGIYNLYRLRAKKSIDIELSSEIEVMSRLLEMVNSQKVIVNNRGISLLETAILEMRIARIKFSPDYRTSTA